MNRLEMSGMFPWICWGIIHDMDIGVREILIGTKVIDFMHDACF
jgi:hypothetical protein